MFISNKLDLDAEIIALIYKKRWYIETLFRKLKQNFILKYFLGGNQNAIEIQIWTAYIAMLLMEVVRKQLNKKWGFSNMVSMVRFHLMNYINLISFLNDPTKAWTEQNKVNLQKIDLLNSSP